MTTQALLLTEKQARRLLAGVNPEEFTPPIRLGPNKFFSRAALDRAVKEKAGLAVDDNAPNDGGKSAYDLWKESLR